jgi:hypothetical protein
MATQHPASSYSKDQRVKVELKSGTAFATVKKVFADTDKLLIIPEEGQPREGDQITIAAYKVSKVRGPLPGTKRGPNKNKAAAVVDEDEDEADDTAQTSSEGMISMSIEDAEQFLTAFQEMSTQFEALIKAAKKPAKSGGKPALMKGAKRRPAAEDEDED